MHIILLYLKHFITHKSVTKPRATNTTINTVRYSIGNCHNTDNINNNNLQ